MISDQIKALSDARAKVATLEQAIASELKRELATLPSKFGFSSVHEFIGAVRRAAGRKRGRKSRSSSKPAKTARARIRKRATITDAMRAEVKKLSEAGKTGGEIAKAVGISLPSVHNIRKALGLVKKKK